MVAEIASAAGSLLSNVFGSIFSNNSAKKVARENRQFALEMWNKNNEYNTPLNQMNRLKEAGLNPNLMYGQGTTGNASAPASAEGRKPTQYDFMPALQMYQQIRMNKSQQQLQDSQAELNHAQAAKVKAETDNTTDTNQFNREARPKILQKYDLENQNVQLSNENLNKINNKIEADINQIKANTSLTNRQADVAKATLGKILIESQNAIKQGRTIDLQQVEQDARNQLWKQGINPNSSGTNGLIDWLRNSLLTPNKVQDYNSDGPIKRGIRMLKDAYK